MALTTAQKTRAYQWWVLHRSPPPPASCRFTKAELQAAADAAETWIAANQASYVAALAGTAFAGAGSTADEKFRLFLAVLLVRNDYDLEQ